MTEARDTIRNKAASTLTAVENRLVYVPIGGGASVARHQEADCAAEIDEESNSIMVGIITRLFFNENPPQSSYGPADRF